MHEIYIDLQPIRNPLVFYEQYWQSILSLCAIYHHAFLTFIFLRPHSVNGWKQSDSMSLYFVVSDGGPELNNVAHVTLADIEAENGVVHVISHVLIPSSLAGIIG